MNDPSHTRSGGAPASHRLLALVRLGRPLNLVMVGAGVWVGFVLSSGVGAVPPALIVAVLAACALGAASNASNDVFDVEVDRINRPDRPLPAGLLSSRTAVVFASLMALAGILLAAMISATHLAIAIVSVILFVLYSGRLKRVAIAGNLLVAGLVSLSLVFGGLLNRPVGTALWFGVGFAVLTTWAREIVKDIEDAAGDVRGGARTMPLVWGARRAASLALALMITTILALPAPYLALRFPGSYLALALPAAALLLAAMWRLAAGNDPTAGARAASGLLKGSMVFGLAALMAAGLA